MPPRPCHFYQTPRGCNKGNDCKFTHLDPASTLAPQSPSASPGPSTPRGPTLGLRQINESPAEQLPSGVCRFYWTKGECKREFDCRYRHIRPDSNQEPISSSPSRPPLFSSPAAREMIAPFLTEQGLAKLNGNATDGFFTSSKTSLLSPTEAHDRLKRFLFDNFRFKSSFDIYAFLVPLASANSTNSTWTQEEGQLLLRSLTSANGSLRIADIINWPAVSMKAGQNREVLSFQRGIWPLLRYMSSEFVIKSTLITQANHLYTIILNNLPRFAEIIETSLEQAIKAQSFKDPLTLVADLTDAQIFASIAGVLHEFLVRFKNAVASYPQLPQLIKALSQRFAEWHSAISANPTSFSNPFKDVAPAVRDLLISSLKEKVDRLNTILEREEGKLDKKPRKDRHAASGTAIDHQDGLVAALHTTYEGPGHLREKGPRHDNDYEDIFEIRIAPTNSELMCRIPPFLPGNFFAAPHPAPPSSMQRLLDIQFRLLREELIAPLRKAVQLVHDDLNEPQLRKTKLWDLLQKQGGKYRGLADTQDSLMFNVYTGVQFTSLVPDWKGISTGILIDTPPGRARSSQSRQRAAFWDSMSGKRLSQGGLIALVWKSGRRTDVHLGVIASSSKELTDHVRADADHVKLRIIFFDSQVELRVLQELRNAKSQNFHGDTKLLVESPVMFESIRPFLEALQTEPEDVPFSRYLVHQPPGQLATINLSPPRYASLPNFKFQLSSLFNEDAGINDLSLSVTDLDSIQRARTLLREKSRLDPSQADAVVDTLTREVALIQGPPGTGKSFTGVEILRVLQANQIGPILMIAFTNHALDHMLLSVLDAGITSKIVRLGRRSNDERIAQYSIETLEMAQNHSRLDRAFNFRRELKDVQKHIKDLMDKVLYADLENDSTELMKYLSTFYPEHHDYFCNPPLSITNVRILLKDDDGDAGEWQKAGRNGRSTVLDTSIYAFWKECTDLSFVKQVKSGTYPANAESEDSEQMAGPQNKFSQLTVEGLEDESDSDSESESDLSDADEALDVQEIWQKTQYEIIPPVDDQPLAEVPPTPPPENIAADPALPETVLGPGDFHDVDSFLASIGFLGPSVVPVSDRPLDELLENVGDVWTMSPKERRRLHRYWVDETRKELGQSHLHEFERLRDLHAKKLTEVNETREEVRRSLLHKIDIIGCTTTGAAQLTTLLRGLSPRVLLVEEAGQVMEAHILGSLVPSIEHLILIGDPLQLRPTLNNFALSVDNRRGRAIYRFDMSLMERLSESGLAMSTIDVQRRMRPAISSLIRNTLYPKLEDHERVHHYPDVRGLSKNVFFVTHHHKENDGGDDSASKYNTYEVAMIRDLVLYLLRQGCYSNEGDIVVLCAYLGQLARLRDALGSEVAVVIDERDQVELDDQDDERDTSITGDISIERVNVTKRVRLRTVDNYQGEEGRVVILSLVRNAGGLEDGSQTFGSGMRPNIGFLKSENRTNVALSRAREGLYIFGNADNLSSRSEMWRTIIEELQGVDCIGPALPVACHRHPDKIEYVCEPGVLRQIAPDGGCLRPCETRLDCGHNCPYKCHCDDPKHFTVTCTEQCRRLCARDHPCHKLCSEPCGDCLFPISNVRLPCGHTKASVKWCDMPPESNIGGILAKSLFTADIFARNRAQRTINIQTDAKRNAGKCACMPNVASLALHRVHPAKNRVLGIVHITLAQFRADLCPSVCGEDCSIQSCPECSPGHKKEQVVDLILSRTLADICPESGGLDDLVITIPACGHTFTIETLDGHTGIGDFYSRNADDAKWLGLKTPDGFVKHPTCPSCRAPITSNRYGRITKRAALDILERNVASHMSRSLSRWLDLARNFDEGRSKALLVDAASKLSIPPPQKQLKGKKLKAARESVLNSVEERPISETDIRPDSSKLHFIDPVVITAWQKATSPLFTYYKEIIKIAGTRSAHSQAWEASFSFLYDREIETGLNDPSRMPRSPQEHAMRMAKLQIGQPRPLADRRFLVEAFWATIHIRLTIIRLAQAWLDEIGKDAKRCSPFHVLQWATYIRYLLKTCSFDVDKVQQIADNSRSRRQIVKSVLLSMRIELETFRFNLVMSKKLGPFKESGTREALREQALMLGQQCEEQMRQAIEGYSKETGWRPEEAEWLEDNFTGTARTIVEEWKNIEESIMRDTFYQPVRLEEKMDILRAFGFATTGHFYTCPNGHIYTITECGGAMERSRCPECGEVIGGAHHHLDATNQRATEFEELARRIDPRVADSPWANPH